jgi:plastocyanin domain-containing protein
MSQANYLPVVLVMVALTIGGLALMIGGSAQEDARSPAMTASTKLPPIVDGRQDIYLKATQYGTFSPDYLVVKKGVPVRIHYSADPNAGCGREVVFPQFKKQKLAPTSGEALIDFTPNQAGKFPFRCPMNMFKGTIEVI